MTNSPKTAYLIVTQDGLDTIAETTETANNEIADLLAMGCDVVSIPVEWENQNAAESSVSDMIDNGFSLAGIKRRVSNAFGSSSKLKTVIRGVTLATVVACSTAANAATERMSFHFLINHDNGRQTIDHVVKDLTFEQCDPMQRAVWNAPSPIAYFDKVEGQNVHAFDAACIPNRILAKAKTQTYTYKLLVNQDNKIQRVDHSVKGLTFKACDTKRARVWKDYGKANDTAFVDHGKAFPFFDAVCLPEGKKR